MVTLLRYDAVMEKLYKKWKSKELQKAYLLDEPFQCEYRIANLTGKNIQDEFRRISKWQREWEDREETDARKGIRYRRSVCRNRSGEENVYISHVVIPSAKLAIELLADIQLIPHRDIGRLRELREKARCLWEAFPQLHAVLGTKLKLLHDVEDAPLIVNVLQWLQANPDSMLYRREIAIPGIDSKFIERQEGVLHQLLGMIDETNVRDTFKTGDVLVRFRFLDGGQSLDGFRDVAVPYGDFQRWHPDVDRVFIVENKTIFLTFPRVPRSLIIFGSGYQGAHLGDIPWLHDVPCFYWGDLDTHGFQILASVREKLPHVQSFLMTEDVLLAHRAFWVTEEKPVHKMLSNLTDKELHVCTLLQQGILGEKIRLEQEFVKSSYVDDFIKEVCMLQ